RRAGGYTRSRTDPRAMRETRSQNGRADAEEEVSRAGPWSGRARVGSRQGEEYGPPRVHDGPDDAAVARHGDVVDRPADSELLGRAVRRSEDEEPVGPVEDCHALARDSPRRDRPAPRL